MLDEGAKKILKLKFPQRPQVAPRQFTARVGREKGHTPSNKALRVLSKFRVPPGGVLNPYGKFGNTFRSRYRATYFKRPVKPALREEAMKRTRIKLQEKKAIALEAHELQQIARENATLAMQTLVEISSNPRAPEATRIAASAVILDRAYGKASQTSITANVSNGKKSDLDSTELDKRISQALKRAEELTNRAPKKVEGTKRPPNLREYN